MSFGIALAGGGIRGAAHVGVLSALVEEGLIPTGVSGTSAGSVIGGMYAAGVSVERMSAMVNEISKAEYRLIDPDYCGILKLPVELIRHQRIRLQGLIKGDKLERFVRKICGDIPISSLKMRTVIPAVDLKSGNTIAYTNSRDGVIPLDKVEWRSGVHLCEAIRASCAVPAIFRPKEMDGMWLVDGGVADVLPVDLLLAAGVTKVLAVDIGEEYQPPKSCGLVETSMHSLSILQERLKDCAVRGESYLLKPKLPKDADLLSFRQMPACVDAGYEAAKDAMPALRQLFGKK